MHELNANEVENVSGGAPQWVVFTLGAAVGSQIGRATNVAVDHVIDYFQNQPEVRNPVHDGRAF